MLACPVNDASAAKSFAHRRPPDDTESSIVHKTYTKRRRDQQKSTSIQLYHQFTLAWRPQSSCIEPAVLPETSYSLSKNFSRTAFASQVPLSSKPPEQGLGLGSELDKASSDLSWRKSLPQPKRPNRSIALAQSLWSWLMLLALRSRSFWCQKLNLPI